MKKFIRILIAVIISCPLIYAQDTGAAAQEDMERSINTDAAVIEAAEFFFETGVFSLGDAVDWSAPLTRSKAVRYLFDICKLPAYASANGIESFYDVPKSHEDFNYIMAARERNLIDGYSDNTFRADSHISMTEFITMTVCVLGYKQDALLHGGYPSGYVQTAGDLDLYKNVKNIADEMTLGDMIKILRKAVDAPLYIQSFSGSSIKREKDKDMTVLSQCYDIYSVKGVMKGNTLTSISGGWVSGEDIEISRQYYHTDSHKFDRYLGYNVELWYRDENGDGDMREALYIKPDGKTVSLKIDANDIAGYEGQKLYYYLGSSKKNVNTDSAFKVIYNNKVMYDYIVDYNDENCVFNQPNGTFTLIDTEGDGKYDLVCIETYFDYVLSSVSTKENGAILNIFGQYGAPVIEFDLDRANLYIEAIGADGSLYTGEDIVNLTAGNVISVYSDAFETINGKRTVSEEAAYVRLEESDKSVTGTLASIGKDEKRITYGIDGSAYYISHTNFLDENKPAIGEARKFLLNANDEIVASEIDGDEETGYQYGYLIKAYADENEQTMEIRMLLLDGTVSKFKCADKLKVNDKKESDFSKVVQNLYLSAKLILEDTDNMSQVVKYKKNANNEITAIETIIDNNHHDDRLSLDSRKRNAMARTKGGVFITGPWQNIAVDGVNTGTARGFYFLPKTILRVPDEVKNNDEYYSTIKLEDEKYYDAEAWDIGKNLTPELMVCYTSGSDLKIGYYYVVEKYYSAVFEDGEIYDMLCVNNGKSDIEFRIEKTDDSEESIKKYNELMSLKKGDVVQLYGDEDRSIVRRAELLQGFDNLPDLSVATSENKDIHRMQFAELYYVDGRKLITQRGPIIYGTRREEQFPWQWSSDSSLMRGAVLYDATVSKTKPIIRAATLDDLKPAYTYGDNGSKVFTVESYGSPNFIVIYNGI